MFAYSFECVGARVDGSEQQGSEVYQILLVFHCSEADVPPGKGRAYSYWCSIDFYPAAVADLAFEKVCRVAQLLVLFGPFVF